jgi:hypothetical protein
MTNEQRKELRTAVNLLYEGRGKLDLLSLRQTASFDEFQDEDKKLKAEDRMPFHEFAYLDELLKSIGPGIEALLNWSKKLDEDYRASWDWLHPVPPKGG